MLVYLVVRLCGTHFLFNHAPDMAVCLWGPLGWEDMVKTEMTPIHPDCKNLKERHEQHENVLSSPREFDFRSLFKPIFAVSAFLGVVERRHW